MPPSLCPSVYIAIVCDLKNSKNMVLYLSLLLLHNHVNDIASNSDFNNKIFIVNFTPYSHVYNYYTTFIRVLISTVLVITVLVLTEQELLLMV